MLFSFETQFVIPELNTVVFQLLWVATRSAMRYRGLDLDLLPWYLLPISLPVPPSKESHFAPENPEEEDQEQGQREKQDTG